MGEANIKRGEKWNNMMAHAKFRGDIITMDWLKSQKSIVDDMEEYNNSKKVEIKSKGKK